MAKSPKPPKLAASALLNRTGFESVAAISYTIEPYDYKKQDKYTTSVSLAISDCTRVIYLSFGMHTEDDYNNALHKCATIKEVVSKLEKDLKTAYEYNKSVEKKK